MQNAQCSRVPAHGVRGLMPAQGRASGTVPVTCAKLLPPIPLSTGIRAALNSFIISSLAQHHSQSLIQRFAALTPGLSSPVTMTWMAH